MKNKLNAIKDYLKTSVYDILFILFVFIILMFVSSLSFGQSIGINNPSPHASSLLDLTSTQKGLLIPRMTLAQRNSIATPANGLTIFQTDDAGSEIHGYYFFDATVSNWIRMSDATLPGWSTSGNSGTAAFTNFIGTVDNQDLVFKSNNLETFRIKPSQKIGFGTSTPGSTYPFAKIEIADENGSNSDLLMRCAGTSYQQFIFHKQRGTLASPLPVVNGDWTGVVVGRGYDGAGFGNASALIFGVDSAVSAGALKGNIQFQTSGGAQAEKMRIDRRGNVGIGTTNPANKLQVINNDSAWATASFKNINTQGWSGLWFQGAGGTIAGHIGYGNGSAPRWASSVYAGSTIAVPFILTTTDIERMRIDANGNVGIDTIAPQARLHVKSNGATNWPQVLVEERDSTDYSRIGFKNKGISKNWTIAAHSEMIDSLSFFNIWNSSTSNQLVMRGDGKIGLGNFNPAYPLSFANTTGDKISVYGGYGNHYGFGIQANLFQIHSANAADDIAFGYGTSGTFTERMRVRGNGDVGINTTAPTAKFEVQSDGTIPYPQIKMYENDSDFARIAFYNNISTKFWHVAAISNNVDSLADLNIYNSSTGNILTVQGNARVGINTTNPKTDLEVNGFTALGSNAPAIKILKLTGTTSNTQGASVSIAHGINPAKILSIDVLIEYNPNCFIHPGYTTNAGYNFNYYVAGGIIYIVNNVGNSSMILSKPFRILITYEQ